MAVFDSKLIEAPGSFSVQSPIIAEAIISSEIVHCLNGLGSVAKEQQEPQSHRMSQI